jgi:uncharacterized repeat protein (TIGR01451 family)
VTSVYGGGNYDAFVTKLDGRGTSLVYSRFLGASQLDAAYGIGLWDKLTYVTGVTLSPDFPMKRPVQGAPAISYEAFVTLVDVSGARLLFSTYLGGATGSDWGRAIAVAPQGGAAYVTGVTSSIDFPTAPSPPLQGSMGGVRDAFVSEITPAAADLSVVKIGPSSAAACTPVNYSIVVTNNGPDNATSVTLVDTLPAGATPVSVSTSVGFCTSGAGTVTCDLGSLPNGASAVVGLTVVPPTGPVFNTATATAREVDLNSGNNTGLTFLWVSWWVPPWCWPFACPQC